MVVQHNKMLKFILSKEANLTSKFIKNTAENEEQLNAKQKLICRAKVGFR